MPISKLKSLPVVALAAALFLLPAPRAEAWKYVCLENWGAYVANLIVVYGFEDNPGNLLPTRARKWTMDSADGESFSDYWAKRSRWNKPKPPERFPAMSHPAKVGGFFDGQADGLVMTPFPFPVLQWRCVDISPLPEGERFYVVAANHEGHEGKGNWTVCDTHESNPRPFYTQRERPYNEIWFAAHGTDGFPRCVYNKEVQR